MPKPDITVRRHRNTTYVDAVYCDITSSVVCLSVCLSQLGAVQNGSTDRDAVWVEDSGGPKTVYQTS